MSQFRYTRRFEATAGAPLRFEPDGRMYGHARTDSPTSASSIAGPTGSVANRAESGGCAVASRSRSWPGGGGTESSQSWSTVAPDPRVVDRVELEIPGTRSWRGRRTGKRYRRGRHVREAVHDADLRRAGSRRCAQHDSGVPAYGLPLPARAGARGSQTSTGASVARDPEQASTGARSRDEGKRTVRDGQATVVVLDLGFPKVPVDSFDWYLRALTTLRALVRPSKGRTAGRRTPRPWRSPRSRGSPESTSLESGWPRAAPVPPRHDRERR